MAADDSDPQTTTSMQTIFTRQLRPRTSEAVRALSSSSNPLPTPVRLLFELARQPASSSEAGLDDDGEALVIAHGLLSVLSYLAD